MAVSKDKRRLAEEMRLRGKTYDEIARAIGCSTGWCQKNLVGMLPFGRQFGTYQRGDCEPHNIKTYHIWSMIVSRCTSDETKSRHPTYKDATIATEFLDYKFFQNWCDNQVGYGKEGYHLDKDIVLKGNKHYSPETCVFVPREINSFFLRRQKMRGDLPIGVCLKKKADRKKVRYQATMSVSKGRTKWIGEFDTVEEAFQAYKCAKEIRAKELAEKYKGEVDERVYEALIAFEVDITD